MSFSSAWTAYDSGSTRIRGVASFHFMSFFVTVRQPRTGSKRFASP